MKYTYKDFLPLISIFLVIIFLTILSVWYYKDTSVMFSMRMFMGFFFLVFGSFKILKWKAFAMAYREYDVIAMRSVLYSYLYPVIEIGLACAYLFAWNLVYTNIVTIVIMLVSAYGVWLKLRKKEEIMCACLGTVFTFPMTKVTLFEDLLMAVMAVGMLVT